MKGAPSIFSLLERAALLLVLIVRAAALYLAAVAHSRGLWRRDPEDLRRRYTAFARHFVAVAARFRGGLIKLGQVASLRIDVLPEEISDELARLQDRVPSHPYEEIAARVEAELGGRIEDHFSEFEREPLAAASLGQVHAARSRSGAKLAVKVLYPGIHRSVAVDLAMVQLALRLFNWVSVLDLVQVYHEIRESLLGEMDYLREGRAAEECQRNLRRDPELFAHLRVPEIHWETTTRQVLTMEFLEGVKINDRAALERLGIDLNDVVRWVSRAFLQMMFRDGFFHCDPHPGNFLIDRDGRVGIVDFGMHKRVSPELLAAVRKNVLASLRRDSALYAESLLDMEMVRPEDVPHVKALAELSFDPRYYNLTPAEIANLDFAEYFVTMRKSMRKIGSFRLPDGVVMWSRAISLLIGLASELAPGLRPLDIVAPYVLEFMQGGPEAMNPGRDARVSHPVE
ncbi:MAG: AarF/UbiB family protein [Myxococcota bacterium]